MITDNINFSVHLVFDKFKYYGQLISTLISKYQWFVLSLVLCLIIFFIDKELPLGIAGGVPYVFPLTLCYFTKQRKIVFFTCVFAILLIGLGYLQSPTAGVDIFIPLINRFLASFTIVFIAYFINHSIDKNMLIEQLRKSEIKISKLHKLPHAFAHVQVLRNSENEISDLFYLSVNDDYAQYFGFHSKSHIENKRYTEIFQLKELKKHWIQHFDQVINSGSKESFLEYSKESERWFDIHCLSPANEELIVLFQDVTEYKSHEAKINKLNEKLQTSNRELEAFSYSVSHDLRAPLRAINGFAKALESTTAYSSDKQTHHYINRINENGMRMGQLIDDLLQFSRLSRESIVLKEIDVTSMVKNIVDTYHSKQKKNISIGRLPVVKGDLNLLQQVFINLISNAIKFSSKIKTPQIEVTGIELDDRVTIIISDNGVGFDMAHKDKLFKVFERLHHQDDFKGTGVGLALCKKIIDKIGGEIWAKSDLGKGASFFVQLKK